MLKLTPITDTPTVTMDTDPSTTDTMARGQLMRRPPPQDPTLTLRQILMDGTAMDTAIPTDTDTTTARGQLMRRPLLLDPTLMRRLTPMDGMAMDMDTPTDTDTTMARGQLMMLPPLDLTLMLMPGTAMATTDTDL